MTSIPVGPLPTPSKVCRKCGDDLPMAAFYTNRDRADGRTATCKKCTNVLRGLREQNRPRDDAPAQKRCPVCLEDKPASEYWKTKRNPSGLNYYCKACQKANNRRKYAESAEAREQAKQKHRAWAYGLTPEQFDTMVAAQAGLCAICGEVPGKDTRGKWHVDHNHETGKVRGLLCSHCNQGLGHFRDNPAALQSAIYYLALHDEWT